MLGIKLDEAKSIVILEPEGELSQTDFEQVANIVDPYLEKYGNLNGIIIYTKTFQGWDSFSALITHIKFVKEHHKKVSHVAFVTDSPIGIFAEHIAGHFVNAEIKSFAFSELENSKKWVSGINE